MSTVTIVTHTKSCSTMHMKKPLTEILCGISICPQWKDDSKHFLKTYFDLIHLCSWRMICLILKFINVMVHEETTKIRCIYFERQKKRQIIILLLIHTSVICLYLTNHMSNWLCLGISVNRWHTCIRGVFIACLSTLRMTVQ